MKNIRISNALKNNSQLSFSIPTVTTSMSSSNMIQLINPNKSLSFDDQVSQN